MNNNRNFSSVSVNVPKQTLWEILIDRIVNPELYLQGVLESSILRESTEIIIRKMLTTAGEIIERIIVDVNNWSITTSIVEHPFFEGTSVNQILSTGNAIDFSVVSFSRNWRSKEPHATYSVDLPDTKEELLRTKKIAEENLLKKSKKSKKK